MKEEIAKQLLQKVKSDYTKIAIDFAGTRRYIWPELTLFDKYYKDNDLVLDLGCGSGRIFQLLTSKDIRYIGIDNNKKFLEIAKKENPKGDFQFGDQLSIPFRDNYFNCVFSVASFHHIPSKILRKRALYEMQRVVKKDGYVVITVWNLYQDKYKKYLRKSFWKWIKSFGKYGKKDVFIPWSDSGVERYYYAFKFNDLEKLLEETDFEIVEKFAVKKGKKVTLKKAFNFCFVCQKK